VYEFLLPDLGEGIHEGEILRWFVSEGDSIIEDEPLVEVETDKAAVTIPSPRSGRVTGLTGRPGDVVHTGQVLCIIHESGEPREAASETADAGTSAQVPAEAGVGAPPLSSPAPASNGAGQEKGPIPAAPATRRLARELGVALADVPPTGPAGRVTPDDVRAFASGDTERTSAASQPTQVPAPPVAERREPRAQPAKDARPDTNSIPYFELPPLPDFASEGAIERVPFRSIRRKVARKMVTSMIVAPHVAHMDEADVTELEALRLAQGVRYREERGIKLNLMSFVMRAVARGLQEWPELNASLDPIADELILKRYVNLGFAADTERGLVVPVIRDAHRKSVLELAKETASLAAGARDGSLEASAMRGGTFTITNIGPLGGTGMIPTINHPEVAILGMAQVREKPVVREGEIVIRKIMPLTLAFDHRVADGAQAARFVTTLIRRLEDPASLLIEG
jgi:pyruvate dehydrogenase E2 component (dihydrolipoamide acetyltransferase)